MKKVLVMCVLASSLAVPVFAQTSFEKVDDYTMKISETQEVKIKYSDLLQRKAALQKALVEVDKLIAEAAKVGVSKTEELAGIE